MVKDTTLYDRLGVSCDASDQEINKAGRNMSKKWHPDKNVENREEASLRFKEIREALDILSNPEKRSLYDQIGMESANHDGNDSFSFHDFMGGMGGMGGFPFGNMGGGMAGMGGMGGMGMPFGNMGGGMGPKQERKENITHRIYVSLEQIAKEENVSFTYDREVLCEVCHGEGTRNGDISLNKDCTKCEGKGMCVQVRHMGPMVQQSVMPCQDCAGKGKKILQDDRCVACNGTTFKVQSTKASIKLQNGISHNMKLKLNGQGHESKKGNTDLILVIQEEQHEVFRREKSHLHVTIELNLYEALFGFTKLIHHINGKVIRVRHDGKTEYNTVRKIVDEGLNDLQTKQKGHLYLHFTFYLPEDIQYEMDLLTYFNKVKHDHSHNNNDYTEEAILHHVSEYELSSDSDREQDENEDQHEDRQQRQHVQECRPM